MIKVIEGERVPIKLWLDDIETGALEQAKNLAALPFVFKHVAIMPDAHEGYGMPIGGVIATKDIVIPNAVGVDIGCGMAAIKTSINQIGKKQLIEIIEAIRKRIPLGFNHHKKAQDENLMPSTYDIESMPVIASEYKSTLKQLGTLGGGNHFVEIQKGNDGYVWIMIHSGSRNLGKKVADYYHKLAVKLNQKWYSYQGKSKDLAFLACDTAEADSYLMEMNYCVEFALANRLLMMESAKDSFREVLGTNIGFYETINIAHNYAAPEVHFNENVIVHRKGATSARLGEKGIIPGSQGTQSYIVEGLGNRESFMSCSHGAGRVMGRKQAQRELSLEAEIAKLNKKGIIHNIRSKNDLDEAAGAYKNINRVMENQKDLVKILYELRPLAVLKG